MHWRGIGHGNRVSRSGCFGLGRVSNHDREIISVMKNFLQANNFTSHLS